MHTQLSSSASSRFPQRVPKVSVILPYFNAERTLEQAVHSILSQTFTDLELILINNCSTDNSAVIAGKCAKIDKRIKCLSESKRGVVFATQKGFENSTGIYISRMDADDKALPCKLQKQVELLENKPDVSAVSCMVRHCESGNIKGGGIAHYVKWSNSACSYDELSLNQFIESPIINPTILIRRSAIESHGLYREGDFPEDYELWLRYFSMGVRIEKIPEILLEWNDSPTRLTRTDHRYSTKAFYDIKTKYLVKYLSNKKLLKTRFALLGAGRLSRKRSDLLKQYGIKARFYIGLKDNNEMNTICYKSLNYDNELFILCYVANWGARDEIRDYLQGLGYQEGKQFLFMS